MKKGNMEFHCRNTGTSFYRILSGTQTVQQKAVRPRVHSRHFESSWNENSLSAKRIEKSSLLLWFGPRYVAGGGWFGKFDRQFNDDGYASFLFAYYLNVATVIRDNLAAQGQAQTHFSRF